MQKSILIVDDEPLNISIVNEILRSSYDIKVATTGEKAIQILQSNPLIDLILLDIVMPNMNGFEVAKVIKNSPETEKIPIIFLTASHDSNSINEAFSAGGSDYISKPFKAIELQVRIENIFKTFTLQKELQDLNNTLEIKVQEGIEKYKEQEKFILKQAKTASMGEMIGAISHQWKQPLNTLSLYIQDLEDAYDYKELNKDYISDFVKKGVSQIEYMAKTIDDFKNFLSPDKKKSSYSLNAAFDKVHSIVEKQLKSKNIILLKDFKYDELFGVEGEMEQVLLNLINNSKDAIAEKQKTDHHLNGKITINSICESNSIIITVCDNGGGIPANVMKKVFTQHFTTKGNQGTGIGLYIIKLIIEQSMLGKIDITNSVDGAIFTIHLPK